MSLEQDLLQAGVPEHPSTPGALDIRRVLRNITTAQGARLRVRVQGRALLFETLVGLPQRVEISIAELWDPSQGGPLTSAQLQAKLKPLRQQAEKDEVAANDAERAASLGAAVGIDLPNLSAFYLVEAIRGFGPQKFKELHDAGLTPGEVAARPELLPTAGKRGDSFKAALAALTDDDRKLATQRAARQIVRADENDARLITYADPHYPANVKESNNPIPLLYVRGNLDILLDRQAVACVGSRNIRPPYDQLQRAFAASASRADYTIVSGFALGADTIAHRAAFEAGGRTIAVMPSGLDRPFPPENRGLWDEMISYKGAAFVTEFPFGTAAASLTLRKRNKLIVAFAQAVLVGQSSATGGAMNAYRFALEQRKPIATFDPDGQNDTSGNKLIGEGGDRPQEKLTHELSPTSFSIQSDETEWAPWLRALSSQT